MENLLITGGGGFIGSEIVSQLYESGRYQVSVLDIMSEQIHGKDWKQSYLYKKIENKCNFIKGDICDSNLMKHLVQENEYIVHLAAETGTGQSMYEINKYNYLNIIGTSNIFQAISDAGKHSKVTKIILSSSRSVYGEGKYECPKCGAVYPLSRRQEKMKVGNFSMYCSKCGSEIRVVPTSEDSPLHPASVYAYTKLCQEKLLELLCPAMGIDFTIFRFQNVYGVGQSLKNPYTGILSVFSSLMLENQDINIFEDGNESRDFINVRDVASSVIKSLYKTECNGEIINIGSGMGTSVIEIAELLKGLYNSSSELKITGDYRIGDIAHNIADISKAEKILDYKVKIDLKTGLKEFCKWVKSSSFDNQNYEKSLLEMEKTGMFIRNVN